MNPLTLMARANAFAPTPLSVRQLMVLFYLARNGAQTFSDVRDALGVSPPTLSRAADALSHAKLLQRTPSRDRRVPVLALTKAGEAFVAEAEGAP